MVLSKCKLSFQINSCDLIYEQGKIPDGTNVAVKKLNERKTTQPNLRQSFWKKWRSSPASITLTLLVYSDVACEGMNACWYMSSCQITIFTNICSVGCCHQSCVFFHVSSCFSKFNVWFQLFVSRLSNTFIGDPQERHEMFWVVKIV
jgi:hypothetical protein